MDKHLHLPSWGVADEHMCIKREPSLPSSWPFLGEPCLSERRDGLGQKPFPERHCRKNKSFESLLWFLQVMWFCVSYLTQMSWYIPIHKSEVIISLPVQENYYKDEMKSFGDGLFCGTHIEITTKSIHLSICLSPFFLMCVCISIHPSVHQTLHLSTHHLGLNIRQTADSRLWDDISAI